MSTTEKPTVHVNNIAICRNCQGMGTLVHTERPVEYKCPVCEGRGRVRIRKEIRIFIETL